MLTNPTLRSQVDTLWNKFWSGGVSNPLDSIEQMSFLIFLKRLEDMENQRTAAAKRKKEEYVSVYEKHLESPVKLSSSAANIASEPSESYGEKGELKWTYWSQLPGEEMLTHVRDVVFPFLRNLGGTEGGYFQFMKDATFIIDKPSLLQEAVRIIDEMNISDQNADVQGDLYEYLLGELATAGKNGQFRTPRHIIKMMVELLDPDLNDRICDPSCGTAGFLVSSYEYLLEKYTSPELIVKDAEGNATNRIGDKLSPKAFKFIKEHALTGYDFDRRMVRIAAMNLMLHGIDAPSIFRTDTLSKQFNEAEEFNVILANPPFKGSIDDADVNPRFALKTRKTELLFVELIYDLLITGGRAAVIVPDGVLFGSSNAHQTARKIILDECQLEGVISMPSGVFKPYAGVSTAILLFTKGGDTRDVWFYDMQADGYSLDDKRTPIDGHGDIPDIISKFKNWKAKGKGYTDRKAKAFVVAKSEIVANKYDLSINRYKEEEHVAVEYEKPAAILKRLKGLEKEISGLLEEL